MDRDGNMRILMINIVCGIRSTGRICTDLATVLEEQGHEVKIAYGRENVPQQFKKYAIKIGTEIDIRFHGLKARITDGCGFGSKHATEKFIEWVKKYDPDVIHLHNLHGYYINLEILFGYLKICGKRIIWTLHDCWAFTGHSAYCDAVECKRWITGCYDCPNKRKYPKSFIDRSKVNWVKKKTLMEGISNLTIVTPSKWLAGLVKESFLSIYPTIVIRNGIDISQFFPLHNDTREYFDIGSKFMLLGVATAWDDMKGLSDYLNLAEKLGDEYRIVLVGVTHTQLKRLPSNVIGIERTNSIKELKQLYSAADLYLNLSYCENYPTSNLEAWACGTSVLTYRTGGSPESVEKFGGIVVERGDLYAVEEAIRKFKYEHPVKAEVKIPKRYIDYKTAVSDYVQILGQSQSGGGYWKYKQRLGWRSKFVILDIATSWNDMKGYLDFIEIAKKLDNIYQIVLIGLSKSQLSDLPDNIIGLQKTNNIIELAGMYSCSDILLNLSKCESYGMVNIESALCGTPVISYDSGGLKESTVGHGIIIGRKEGVDKVIEEIKKITVDIFNFHINQNEFDRSYAMLKYVELVKQ